MVYSVLDVAVKVGFGLLSINTLSKLEKFPVWDVAPESASNEPVSPPLEPVPVNRRR